MLRDDLEFARNQMEWPVWPWLPVKRRRVDGQQEIGYLIGNMDAEPEPAVWIGNMYDRDGIEKGTHEKREYSNLEALFADEWVVD